MYEWAACFSSDGGGWGGHESEKDKTRSGASKIVAKRRGSECVSAFSSSADVIFLGDGREYLPCLILIIIII